MENYKKRKIITKYILVLISIIIVVLYYSKILPLAIIKENSNNIINKLENSNQNINLFEDYNFENNHYSIYIINNDLKNNFSKILYTKDINILNKFKNKFNFKVTNGDIASTNSYFLFLKNNKIIFKMGVVLNKEHFGLQSTEYGWIEPTNNKIYTLFSKMEKSYKPIFIFQ